MVRRILSSALVIVVVALGVGPSQAAESAAMLEGLTVQPGDITLQGPFARQALLVSGKYGLAGEADLTRRATFTSLQPAVATVSAAGIVTPRSDGITQIVVRYADRELRVPVAVRGFSEPIPVDFRTDAIAALSHAGCNQGACHGSPQGKNGFHLSLRGYEPDLDYLTLTREAGGRRIDRLRPENSLILLKGTGRVPHQGGIRFRHVDPAYRTLRRWIAEGGHDSTVPAELTRLEVLPELRRLHTSSPQQQLVVRAHFQDGSSRDVSDLAVYDSSQPGTARVSPGGLVDFTQTGEVAILVRYLDHIVSTRLTYVRHDPAFVFKAPPPANYIDESIFAKQRELQLTPAPLATDAVFLRRVYLDTIGTLPTADETRAFLDSKDPKRREKLIDQLLNRDEYGSFWALKWADVMRGSPTTISERGVHSFHRYLVRQFAEDRAFDVFARELLTSLGNTLNKPAANFYRISRTPDEAAETVAQLFLGVRLQCAKCHNHPFESLTQTDYYGLAAFFARVQRKGAQFGLDDEVIFLQAGGEVQHPHTRRTQEPIVFGSPTGKLGADEDRRQRLADWLVRADNRYFAPSVANRVWFHLLGRGLVDPVDDFRATNPPSHPTLLKALADNFVRNGYHLKPLIRTILNSRTYQLASDNPAKQSPQAAQPDRYFTQAAVRMLTAEQILDGISQATGVPESFPGYPPGTRAIELAEGGVHHPFLQAFARPVRDVTCECAREEDPSLPEMMHLLNNAEMLDKIRSPKGHIAQWLREGKNAQTIVELIYLSTLSRRPTPPEQEIVLKHLAKLGKEHQTEGLQDLQHALVNLSEFLVRH